MLGAALLTVSCNDIDEQVPNGGALTKEQVQETNVAIPASVTDIEEDIFHGCSNLTVTVIAGSYAEQYCKDHVIPFVYADPQN